MSRSLLHPPLFAVGIGSLVGSAGVLIAGGSPGITLWLAIPGIVLLLGLLIERWRYQPLTSDPPGPGWVRTDERFIDPETGRLVAVFYRPSTGERRYVAV